MNWIFEIYRTQPVAHAVGVLACVCVVGMALGSLKFRGIGLGTAGVLFAGILIGHFGKPVEAATLHFVKEFGLILFVFTMGLQLGPGFFASLRQQGIRLNMLAAAVVVAGAVAAPVISALAGFDPAAVLGIFAGASVNIPALGAGTQALGTLPIAFPGLPQPVKLGLAGGPLIVALILGRIGRIGRQVWHMPVNTNLAFREFGIALFFAAVGLEAGEKFFSTAFSVIGLQWLLAGLCVTVPPLLLIGVFGRAVWKLNFVDLSGLIAGSTTNPPALSFANTLAGSSAPSVAYATVYPLTTLLRILSAQILVIILFR